jgi:hypothetical protein
LDVFLQNLSSTGICTVGLCQEDGMNIEYLKDDGIDIAVVSGDSSHYTSKPLKDFMYESNHGKDFFFVPTREEAVQKLTGTQ